MNSPSVFQGQYPLSSKKLWKKLISNIGLILALSVVFGGVSGLLIVILSPTLILSNIYQIPLMIIPVLFTIITLLYLWYVRVYIRRYYYDVMEFFVTIQKGVFAPAEIHVPYGKIQDVYVDQDILDRILGIYDVHIASATISSGIEAHIDGVDPHVAEGLKNLMLNKIQHGGSDSGGNIALTHGNIPNKMTLRGPKAGVFNSQSFPIVSKWFVMTGIANIWFSAMYTVFVWAIVGGKHSDGYALSIHQIAIIYFVIYAIFIIWFVLWRNAFSFEFLPDFILVKSGVFMREERHVPYRVLQNVSLNQNILERMLGLCTIVIENAASTQSKNQRQSRVSLVGQPYAKGEELVHELNRILGQSSEQGTGL